MYTPLTHIILELVETPLQEKKTILKMFCTEATKRDLQPCTSLRRNRAFENRNEVGSQVLVKVLEQMLCLLSSKRGIQPRL